MNCCDFNADLTKYKTKKTYNCFRISPKGEKKKFKVPRRFSKRKCINGPVNGFTMRSSCAPYKFCKKSQKGGSSQLDFHKKKLKFYIYLKFLPKKIADSPKISSILNNWLYLLILSDLDADPVLIWPVLKPTEISEIILSSVSPDL